jgi:DNA-binding response OmpR family regulator
MNLEKKRKVKILILEDKETEARAIKKNLECNPKRKWEAQYVANLAQFKEKIQQESFDIYVIDYDIPADRGSKRAGGGEKALDLLKDTIGLVPAIIYSGVLQGELQEAEVIRKGASYILQKGTKGSALAALIERIVKEHDERIGFSLKSYFASRLDEKTFYLNLIKEDRVSGDKEARTVVTAEVQRLFDEKPVIYELHLDKNGEVIHARQKKAQATNMHKNNR